MFDKTRLLLVACAALSIIILLLTVLLFRARRGRNDMARQLEKQLERVDVRKQKILQLRAVITLLINEVRKNQETLKSRPSNEELQEYYNRISDAMLRIYKRMDLIDRKKSQITNSEFCMLTEQIAVAFDVENNHSMPWYVSNESEDNHVEVNVINTVRRVLVVDDNQSTANMLVRILEMNGCRTETVSSGEEAIDAFIHSKEGYYSFIFMDIVLGGMSGYDAAREIRRSCRYDSERIPIIAVTANDFAEDMFKIQEAGINDRILKPITEDSVRTVTGKWMSSAESLENRTKTSVISDQTDNAAEEKVDDTWVSLSSSKGSPADKTDDMHTSR